MMLPFALVTLLFVFGANAQVVDSAQVEHTPDIPFNPRTPFTLPQEMFEFMERYNWGDFHMVFHMSRKYYVIGDQGRRWLDRNAEKPAPFQEGDPKNGLEFLCMHRAMIEYLTQRFGKLPVNNDPEGKKTVAEVLRGWDSDDKAIRGLTRYNGDVRTFQAGLDNVNNFGQFRLEDDFGLFVQTSMRLQGTVDPNNPARRQYASDRRPGSGIHNWLHGQLMDDTSPITVGDPRTNLGNILFWNIHGWIEAKWKQFEAAHSRTAEEQALYNGFMTQFRAHMIGMSEKRNPNPPPPLSTTTAATTTTRRPTTSRTTRPTTTRRTSRPFSFRSLFSVEQERIDAHVGQIMGRIERNLHRVHRASRHRVPWSLVYHIRHRMFRNHVPECRTLSDYTVTDTCPDGNGNGGNHFVDRPPANQAPRRQPPRNRWDGEDDDRRSDFDQDERR